MNEATLAYLFTWTTYGTWLPGDERGWIKWHGGFQQPSEALRQYSTAKMVEPAITLDPQQREVVDANHNEAGGVTCSSRLKNEWLLKTGNPCDVWFRGRICGVTSFVTT